MMRTFRTSSGKPGLVIEDKNIYSPYDPTKEAARFIETSFRGETPGTVIIIGAGLGYLFKYLNYKWPQLKVLGIYFSNAIFRLALAHPPGYWFPEAKCSLAEFLDLNVVELDLEGLRVLYWKPMVDSFPKLAAQIMRTLNTKLQQLRGSYVTIASVGKTWLRNSVLNFLNLNAALESFTFKKNCPVLIAASGPSLVNCLDLVKQFRSHLNLWALPSSLSFLLGNKITPDLIVSTDPNYYARVHLYPLKNFRIPLAMPLSAEYSLARLSKEVFLLSQPNFFEQDLLSTVRFKFLNIPPQGTVAASAYLLARRLTAGPVIFAGLDLCYFDIQSHVIPSLFSDYADLGSNKIYSCHARTFAGAQEAAPGKKANLKTSVALQTYADWFNAYLAGKQGVFLLNPHGHQLDSVDRLGVLEFSSLMTGYERTVSFEDNTLLSCWPGRQERQEIVLKLLDKWTNQVKDSGFEDTMPVSPVIFYLGLGLLTQIKRAMRRGEKEKARLTYTKNKEEGINFLSAITTKVMGS